MTKGELFRLWKCVRKLWGKYYSKDILRSGRFSMKASKQVPFGIQVFPITAKMGSNFETVQVFPFSFGESCGMRSCPVNPLNSFSNLQSSQTREKCCQSVTEQIELGEFLVVPVVPSPCFHCQGSRGWSLFEELRSTSCRKKKDGICGLDLSNQWHCQRRILAKSEGKIVAVLFVFYHDRHCSAAFRLKLQI